jgi:peptidoglycan-associated lipoprotein
MLKNKCAGAVVTMVLFSSVVFGCADKPKPVEYPPTGLTSATFKSHWDKPSRSAKNGALTEGEEGAEGLPNKDKVEDGLNTSGLHVSDAIARACNLPKRATAPQFDFDSTTIGPDDREVLGILARCLSEGALKGKALVLTGRADARGEIEYNMSLGESRADSVRRYLHDLGVGHERVTASSRGELDAVGTDEAGYALDRRVDIALADTASDTRAN